MAVLLVLTMLVTVVGISLSVAMLVRDDSYLGMAGLMIMMAAFIAMTYGVLNAT